ncbi:MAG: DUF664 domain-containing protein [Dehalococcoidia bacterium]
MEGAELIKDGLTRINRSLHRSLTGVTAEVLCKLPTPDTNSMAWLAWHMTRVHDDHLADLIGGPELWVSDKWHERFDMPPDESDTGTGHTAKQVAALKVDSPEVLLDYADAVLARSVTYLDAMKPADLDVEINEPQWDPLPTVGVRLVSVILDNGQHAGQVAYLRGYFEGLGWQRV